MCAIEEKSSGKGPDGECLCKWCIKYSPLFTKIESLITAEENVLLNDFIGESIHDGTDAVFWKEKFQGTWPGTTVEDLQHQIQKLEQRIIETQKNNDYIITS